jgi:hypothetical protein
MKSLACAVIVLSLAGCASNRQPQAMSYEQLNQVKVTNGDCRNMDSIIGNMKKQLKLRGLENATPEDLNDADRMYNAQARIVIWSLIIGCNNPDRYRK